LSDLPVLQELEPLLYKNAPKGLPPASRSPLLLKATNARAWGVRSIGPRSVYVRVKGNGLSRLQLGSPSSARGGSERVYRRCGTNQHTRGSLTPARWDTFELRDGAEPSYSISNAWFEGVSCNASVVQRVEVKPATIVEGLLYAFVTACRDCGGKRRLSLLMPPASDAAIDAVGGSATTTHGAFTVVHMPLRRGGAGAFTATLRKHAVGSWARKLGVEAAAGEHVRIGMDVVHAVGDDKPTAIAYASEQRPHKATRSPRNHRRPRIPKKRRRNRGDIFGFR
jgi:hypothetical protein